MYHAGAVSALPPIVALGVLSVGIASMLAVGIIGQQVGLPTLVSLTIASALLLGLPIAAMVHLDLRGAVLGLRRPRPGPVVAALLIGTTAWYLNMRLVQLFPFEEGHLRGLNQLVDEPPLLVVLLAIAVVPAICEEVMFRGAVQRALATRLFPPAAVVATSLLFASYHMSLIQLLPTFTLGVALGALAHRGDSVIPPMLAHFLNNALAILVARKQPAALASAFEAHPNLALAGCALATAVGVSLIAKAPA